MLRRRIHTLVLALVIGTPATAEIPANELGHVPILTYHKIADTDTQYTRSRQGFASDLVQLKKHGFFPVTLAELRSGRILTPKGRIPVLITFDDSSESQFKFEPDGSLTAGCGVEIMERFQKQNADYPLRGVFFVLPKAQYPSNFFGQTDKIGKKLQYLTAKGFEIGSHTLWHANLKQYRDKIEEQLALSVAEIHRYLKDYPVHAFALPYGIFPPQQDELRLRSGSFRGKTYRHDMIFDYSNTLSLSVYDREFNPYRIRRLHGNKKTLQNLFRRVEKERQSFFISDGNAETVTVPKAHAGRVKLKSGLRLVTY